MRRSPLTNFPKSTWRPAAPRRWTGRAAAPQDALRMMNDDLKFLGAGLLDCWGLWICFFGEWDVMGILTDLALDNCRSAGDSKGRVGVTASWLYYYRGLC